MTRTGLLALLPALVALASCGTPTSGAQSGVPASAAPVTRAPAAVQAAPAPAEPAVAAEPETVRLRLSVTSVRGDFGSYIVNKHDGPAKQTTFDVDRAGKWSTEIEVPNASMVKLDIARIGARCEIRVAGTDEVLIEDENSCIVGS